VGLAEDAQRVILNDEISINQTHLKIGQEGTNSVVDQLDGPSLDQTTPNLT